MSRGADAAFPAGIEAVIFDMDGTLIESHYDWPAIRAELGVEGPSLVDSLNALPEGRRSRAWARMCEIETRASRAAKAADGASELLDFLAGRAVKTALVTNNSKVNADDLCARFDLRFDVIITRDSGLFKPSPAPLLEAMRRLGADPSRTMAVGDSKYDLLSARDAGCAWFVVVNGGYLLLRDRADHGFRDLKGLLRLLRAGLGDTVTAAVRASDRSERPLTSRRR